MSSLGLAVDDEVDNSKIGSKITLLKKVGKVSVLENYIKGIIIE